MNNRSSDIGKMIAIRYKGRLYDHYGILDGAGNIIHVNKKKGIITLDPIGKVLIGSKKVTIYDDDLDSRIRTYQHANALIGSPHQYRFLTDNCETWVNKIRCGKAYSRQINDATRLASMAILAYAGLRALGGRS